LIGFTKELILLFPLNSALKKRLGSLEKKVKILINN